VIVVNGVPKSGTHAVLALLDTFGLKRCPGTLLPLHDYYYVEAVPHLTMASLQAIPDNCYILAHVPALSSGQMLQGLKFITVFRDPRNCLVSYCRHRKRVEDLNVSIAEAIRNYWGSPFVGLYESYLGWRGKSVVLRYEDLPGSVVGSGQGIYKGSGTDWNTRTGAPSRWQAVWTEEDEAAWVKAGGPELLVKAGYD
jgi:Sulfotransferase domain